jgi:hypothetical protein
MKASKLTWFTNSLRLASTGLFVVVGAALAQEVEPVLDRPSRLSDPAPMMPMTASPVLDTITLFPDASEDMSLEREIDDNPWKFVLHGNVTATYNDNIFISNSNEQEDFIYTIAPGIAVGRGEFRNELASLGSYETRFNPDRSDILAVENYIFVHYVPSVTLFAQNGSENTFNHDVTLDGQYEWKRLTIGLKARYQTMNLPDVDLGERIERELFTGILTSKYDLTGKTSIELNFFNYVRDLARDRVDSMEVRGQAWVNYQVKPKISLGVGFSYGYVDLSRGPSQSYQQVLSRLRYRATEKVRFDLTAGVEFRDIQGLANRTNGIFSLGVSYLPFDGTSVYLQGYRRMVTSANFPPANFVVTGVDAQFRQRFAKRFYFVVAAGYQKVDYEFFTSPIQRDDDVYYIHPSLGMDITSWLSCEIGGQYRRNESTRQRNDFSETTVYVQFNAFF